jgi:pimeloyl-ACP methyl ester carboxylesterase
LNTKKPVAHCNLMQTFGKTIFFLLPWFLVSGCFYRWSMSDKEIRQHYADKGIVEPSYFIVRNDSVALFCATTGADTLPPLLLIHGAPGAWYSGMSLIDDSDLQKKFHIIAVDRPGYHRSRFKGKKKAVTSIEKQAVIIHEALRLNRSKKPGVLFGTSYGAPIAAEIALKYPNEFDHLIMVGGAIDPSNEKFWWFSDYARSTMVRLFLPRYINRATDEKFSHVDELNKLLPHWKELNMPVTVVQGSNDQIVPIANFEFAKEQLRGKPAEFIMIPGAGHLVRRSHPEVIKAVLMELQPSIHPAGTGFTTGK